MAALLALAAAVAGCARARAGDIPTVHLGADACARCGMTVSEERFAAGYVDAKGESVVFDDAGEFLAEAAEHPELMAVGWVHDTGTGRWLKASGALFRKIDGFPTPMGTGAAAFASKAGAEAFLGRLAASSPRRP